MITTVQRPADAGSASRAIFRPHLACRDGEEDGGLRTRTPIHFFTIRARRMGPKNEFGMRLRSCHLIHHPACRDEVFFAKRDNSAATSVPLHGLQAVEEGQEIA